MRNTTMFVTALVSAGILSTAGAALAQDGAQLYAAKTCVACHGAEGKKPILPAYPKVAGQNKDYLVAQMKDIKSGTRNNGQTAAMKGVMHLVSDQEMDAIADWLAKMQ